MTISMISRGAMRALTARRASMGCALRDVTSALAAMHQTRCFFSYVHAVLHSLGAPM